MVNVTENLLVGALKQVVMLDDSKVVGLKPINTDNNIALDDLRSFLKRSIRNGKIEEGEVNGWLKESISALLAERADDCSANLDEYQLFALNRAVDNLITNLQTYTDRLTAYILKD